MFERPRRRAALCAWAVAHQMRILASTHSVEAIRNAALAARHRYGLLRLASDFALCPGLSANTQRCMLQYYSTATLPGRRIQGAYVHCRPRPMAVQPMFCACIENMHLRRAGNVCPYMPARHKSAVANFEVDIPNYLKARLWTVEFAWVYSSVPSRKRSAGRTVSALLICFCGCCLCSNVRYVTCSTPGGHVAHQDP